MTNPTKILWGDQIPDETDNDADGGAESDAESDAEGKNSDYSDGVDGAVDTTTGNPDSPK